MDTACIICEASPDVEIDGAWYCVCCRPHQVSEALAAARERIAELEGEIERLRAYVNTHNHVLTLADIDYLDEACSKSD